MPIIPVFGTASGTSTGGSMDLLFSTTLTSKSTDIDTGVLSTIASYKDLRCVLRDIRSDRSSTSSGVRLYLNNDQTGSHYSRAYLEWPNSVSRADADSSLSNFISTIPAANETTLNGLEARNGIIVDILSVNSARMKQYMVRSGRTRPSFGGSGDEALGYIRIGSYVGSTSAITRIVFADSNGDDFLVGASLSVYGLK